MFLHCQPLLGSCTRGMNHLCTSRHNNRYHTTIHVVHFTLTHLLQWTKTRIFPFSTSSNRVLLNKSCSSGVMVQLPMWLKRALLPPLLQPLIVRKQNGHCYLTASALWHFIKLFSVVLEPQQHPAQPVTVYNSVPDYPRTVKCKWKKGMCLNFLQCVMCANTMVVNFPSHFLAQATDQYHFQPVSSKLVPEYPPTTKCKNATIAWKTCYA